jgi:hypothetical protein
MRFPWLALMLAWIPKGTASADSLPTMGGSYAVVRAAPGKAKVAGGKCQLRGRVLIREGDLSKVRLVVVKGLVAPSGRIVADDVPLAATEVDASGVFTAKIEEKPPWVVTTFVPGYEGALVVLDSCGVEFEFHLEPLRK